MRLADNGGRPAAGHRLIGELQVGTRVKEQPPIGAQQDGVAFLLEARGLFQQQKGRGQELVMPDQEVFLLDKAKQKLALNVPAAPVRHGPHPGGQF